MVTIAIPVSLVLVVYGMIIKAHNNGLSLREGFLVMRKAISVSLPRMTRATFTVAIALVCNKAAALRSMIHA
jgi:hypothetical protein